MPNVLSTQFDVSKLHFTVPTYGNLKGKAIFLSYEYKQGVAKPLRLRMRRSSSLGVQVSTSYGGSTQLPYRVHPEDVTVWRRIADACSAYVRKHGMGQSVKSSMLYAKDPSNARHFTHYAKIDTKDSGEVKECLCRFGDMDQRSVTSNPARFLQRPGFELEVEPTILVKSIYFQGLNHAIVTRLVSCRIWCLEDDDDFADFANISDNMEKKDAKSALTFGNPIAEQKTPEVEPTPPSNTTSKMEEVKEGKIVGNAESKSQN
jgi:hypothetical protein